MEKCAWLLNKRTLAYARSAHLQKGSQPRPQLCCATHEGSLISEHRGWPMQQLLSQKFLRCPKSSPLAALSACKCPLVAAVSLYHKFDQTPPVVDKLQRVMHFWGTGRYQARGYLVGGREWERSARIRPEIQANRLADWPVAPTCC